MAAFERGGLEAMGAVGARRAGEDGELHVVSLSDGIEEESASGGMASGVAASTAWASEGSSSSGDVDDRVALVDERLLSQADHHARSVRTRLAEPSADRVTDRRHDLTSFDQLAEFDVDAGDAAAPHADPPATATLGGHGCGGGLVERHRTVTGLDHAQSGQHSSDSGDAGLDRGPVEPPGFAALVQQHRRACGGRCGTHRSVAQLGVHHERWTERDGEVASSFVVEVGADLGQVRAMVGTGVQVDADVAATDDLGQEQVRDARCERSVRRTGERAVEVATVGQVPVAVDEAVHVDDRHRHDRAGERLRVDPLQRPADDLDTADLVTVHGCTQPHHGSFVAAVDHVDRDRHAVAGDESGDRDLADLRFAGHHVEIADGERCATDQPPSRGRRRGDQRVVQLGSVRRNARRRLDLAHDFFRFRRRVARSGRPVR